MPYFDLVPLGNKWPEGKFLCVGIKPDRSKLPTRLRELGDAYEERLWRDWAYGIVSATSNVAAAYRLDFWRWVMLGCDGLIVLEETALFISQQAPGCPIILNTDTSCFGGNFEAAASFAFERCKVDAMTVGPYVGSTAYAKLLADRRRSLIVQCRTGNPGSDVVQGHLVSQGDPLYSWVARQVANDWNTGRNCALAMDPPYCHEMKYVRSLCPDIPIFITWDGTRMIDLEDAVRASFDDQGNGILVDISDPIIYASEGDDFAYAAGAAVREYHKIITEARAAELLHRHPTGEAVA